MKNKLKAGILLFILAGLITFVGAIFKIQHLPSASLLLIIGLVLQLPAAILIVLGLVRSRTPQQL